MCWDLADSESIGHVLLFDPIATETMTASLNSSREEFELPLNSDVDAVSLRPEEGKWIFAIFPHSLF